MRFQVDLLLDKGSVPIDKLHDGLQQTCISVKNDVIGQEEGRRVDAMVNTITSVISVISTVAAIYEWAVIKETQKRRSELQFLLVGIYQLTLAKQMEWNNQMSLLARGQNEKDMEILRVHMRARDSFMEIGSAITALESVIDTGSSAITAMLEKNIKQTELNNRLQTEGLKNPTLPQSQKTETK